MAKGMQAIARLAAETRTGLSAIDRASNALQAAGFWPIGARGGGRTTPHVEIPHLINMAIAMAAADPVTAAAKAVARYRALAVSDTVEVCRIATAPDGTVTTELRRADARRSGLAATFLRIFGNEFGAHLDGLLTAIQQPQHRTLRDLLWGSLTVTLTIDADYPQAAISFATSIGDPADRTIQTNRYLIADKADLPPPARLARVVTIPFPFLEALLDLAPDTRAGAPSSSRSEKCPVLSD